MLQLRGKSILLSLFSKMKHYPISVRQVLLLARKEELFQRSLAIFIKALFFKAHLRFFFQQN